MTRTLSLFALLLSAPAALAAAPPDQTMLIISLDGMRPDYVTKAAEHGLKIPHLLRIYHGGAFATGVRGVLPTVTYPSHTTILTGVWPAKHGIYSNLPLDPMGQNAEGWYWYASDIRVPTLWEAAAKAGYITGSVSWPVSVSAPGVQYLIPEYWRAPKGHDDPKLRAALSTPGLMREFGERLGAYVGDLDNAEAGDRSRTSYAAALLREKKVGFLTVHLAALDHLEHAFGPFSKEANETLELLDGFVGELEDAARAVSRNVTICVLSDHGFSRIDHELNLAASMAAAGFITLDPKLTAKGHVADWKAYPHPDGGSAAILLKDPKDAETRARVEQFLKGLAADPANGIQKVLNKSEIAALGGRPDAEFWVDMQPNFSVGSGTTPGPVARKVGGTHGYSPTHPDLIASFFIAGPGIRKRDLGEIDMRSIAPTLAKLLGVQLTGDLPALELRGSR